MADLVVAAKNALDKNKRDALKLVQSLGVRKTQELLQGAARDLEKKIRKQSKATGETFTLAQARATLAQVRQVVAELAGGIHGVIVEGGGRAADAAAGHTIEYLQKANKAFKGIGEQPLALKEATMLEEAVQGARASVLHRLATSGEDVPGADEEEHPARVGILARYGVETVRHFEKTLQRGLIAQKTYGQMADDITEDSPFLQQAPRYWAERIVRTEIHGAYNRASWESIREADQQLEDMVKFLSAVFDERTGADSYAVHGQCRRPEEAFESWFGLFQHPPDRPNDRGTVVPHRISWPIPPYLFPRGIGAIMAAWRRDGRKGRPPERPLLTTIPFNQFGKSSTPELPSE